MCHAIARIGIALITFIVGVVLASAGHSLREPSKNGISVLGYQENGGAADDEPVSSDQEELLKVYHEYAAAQTRHDVAFFEQTEAEEFILFQPYGKNLSRSEDIELLKTLAPDIKYAIDDLRVRFYGDSAVVTGRMTATFPNAGSHTWQWIDVCVRRNGRWQILSTTQLN